MAVLHFPVFLKIETHFRNSTNSMGRPRRASFLERGVQRLFDRNDVAMARVVAGLLLILEAILCINIIKYVSYTEIDWIAYMDEVGGYDKGERDYMKLQGDTGPLVYPAGFVYLFSWLRHITGGAILPAQYIFAGLYVAVQAVVMVLYIQARSLPPCALILLCLSRRMHSIFVLRLFNDGWAMAVAYAATAALLARRWALAVLLFSLAVSIKMNVLLFAPGVLAILIKEAPLGAAIRGVAAGVVLQLTLGAPFLLTYPKSYVLRAFELSRVFTFQWSVNWQFLPEHWFTSRQLATVLLFLHLRLLWTFCRQRWFKEDNGLGAALARFFSRKKEVPAAQRLSSDAMLQILFASNIIGVVCARSLHYQFYSWYFHMVPFVLLRSRLPTFLSLCVFFGIEIIWNIFPPRPVTSAVLVVLHVALLWACWTMPQLETTAGRRRAASKRR